MMLAREKKSMTGYFDSSMVKKGSAPAIFAPLSGNELGRVDGSLSQPY